MIDVTCGSIIAAQVSEQNLSGIGFVKTVYLLLNIDVLNYYCIKLVDIVYYIYTTVFVFQLNAIIDIVYYIYTIVFVFQSSYCCIQHRDIVYYIYTSECYNYA